MYYSNMPRKNTSSAFKKPIPNLSVSLQAIVQGKKLSTNNSGMYFAY